MFIQITLLLLTDNYIEQNVEITFFYIINVAYERFKNISKRARNIYFQFQKRNYVNLQRDLLKCFIHVSKTFRETLLHFIYTFFPYL